MSWGRRGWAWVAVVVDDGFGDDYVPEGRIEPQGAHGEPFAFFGVFVDPLV